MKKVLVTGANEQLGQCIQKIASTYSNLEFSLKNSKDFDITNPESVKATFDSTTFDFCINCAAYTNVEQAEKTPAKAFKVNAKKVKSFLFIFLQIMFLMAKKRGVFIFRHAQSNKRIWHF